jgi:hypothetical protein
MCEYSSDRAGLLACGNLNTAISAMVKLVAPKASSQVEFEKALAMIDAQDDSMSNRLAEVFQTHPMLIRRINKLRDYSRTQEYQYLQAGVNENVGKTSQAKGYAGFQNNEQPLQPIDQKEDQKSAEERWPWLKPKE